VSAAAASSATETVAELRNTQQRAAQARAALTAAQQLRTVRFAPPARPPGPHRGPTAADLAATSFPGSVTPPPAPQPAPGQHGADQARHATRRPTQPRPRGPTRQP
jgi:hypothetical protein